MTKRSLPPRRAEALLERRIDDEHAREGVIGDLREEYVRIVVRYPRPMPWIWCWATALMIAHHYRRQRADASFAGIKKTGGSMHRIAREARFSARALLAEPLFTTVVVLTLAIGIAANTVVFTVVDGVLLSPLPYLEPERLVRLYNFDAERPGRGSNFVVGPAFAAYRELADVFDGLATEFTYREMSVDLVTGEGEPIRTLAMPISAGLFETLGVDLELGREFRREEEGGDRVVIVGHAIWDNLLQADPDAIGRPVQLDGLPFTVVGVAPAGFRNPLGWQVDLWLPENLQTPSRNSWENNYLSVVGRLRPGVSLEAANARLDALTASLHETFPESAGLGGRAVPLLEDTVGGARSRLYVLAAAVAMVLMIVCVNVASLTLIRASSRGRDFAVRSAMGASRADLLRQTLSESLMLAVVGGMLGLLLSFGGVRALRAANLDVPRIDEVAIDAGVLAFTVCASLLTALIFGVAPALRMSRPDLTTTLRSGDRGASASRAQSRVRGALVVVEVALAVVLLIGAGLLVKSLYGLSRAELGFRPDGVLAFEVNLPTARYREPEQRIAFFERWFERVRELPGVESVGATSYLPTEGRYHRWNFGRPDIDPDQRPEVERDNRMVAGDYFDAMGIELLRGRPFGPQDGADAPGVVILNRYLAERGFPDRDALRAKILQMGREWEVVGIVDDTAHDPRGSVVGKIYYPHAQFAWNRNWTLVQTVRAKGEPTSLLAPLRAALSDIDPQLVLYRVRTLREVVDHGISPERFTALVMGMFAATAALLAALGIYGVLSHNVTSRTRELGIRRALGADERRLRVEVLGSALRLVGVGIVLGCAGASMLARSLGALLYGVRPHDPWMFLAGAATLALVTALAAYVPARRATSVDPRLALSAGGSAR